MQNQEEHKETHKWSEEELREKALQYHEFPVPGKFTLIPTKKMENAQDLSLAYSPGVAYPCKEIHADPSTAYRYTNKPNMVAVVSNGTAVLGLGNLGALASKPVMEGKAVLFNKFAGIEAIDLCIDCPDPDQLISVVKTLGPSFGGINLEDIKGPDCFKVERELKKVMDIPVFHDDQHGTAIICLAGAINALQIVGKKIEDCKIVVQGAGAAGIACLNLLLQYGAQQKNAMLLDSQGVIYKGRTSGMNEYKEQLASDTECRTVQDAMKDADIFIGCSGPRSIKQEEIKLMARDPLIFAMANPEPEIRPELVFEARPDAIMGTGRSDYPNQINNVMCFPFLFRGALDCHATEINEPMKMAAAKALASLAREEVPESVRSIYPGRNLVFGREYIIPTPFDHRLMETVSLQVAKTACETGVARKPITDFDAYRRELLDRYHKYVNRTEPLPAKL